MRIALNPRTSLRARLVLSASLVLLLFVALAIGVFDTAFRRSAIEAVEQQLSAQLYALLTVAELSENNELILPETLAEPRFSVTHSGLYGFVDDRAGGEIWRSDSAAGIDAPQSKPVATGKFQFEREVDTSGEDQFVLRFGVAWDLGDDDRASYTFVLVESLEQYHLQVASFRESLVIWSIAATVILLVFQLLSLRWSLGPLTRVAGEIERVEQGAQARLSGHYPDEIKRLTHSINTLVESSQRTLERYRNSLGDLAHSLKTPLAVIRGLADTDKSAEEVAPVIRDQSQRMADIVDYQLKRAASAGAGASFRTVAVEPVLIKLRNTLKKVYADKDIRFSIELPPELRLRMDEGDLLEVLGNVLENACKWCAGEIAVRVETSPQGVRVCVDDDGPGVPEDLWDSVFERGIRAEQQLPGQGIGLSVVKDIMASYRGDASVGGGELGGARVILLLPG